MLARLLLIVFLLQSCQNTTGVGHSPKPNSKKQAPVRNEMKASTATILNHPIATSKTTFNPDTASKAEQAIQALPALSEIRSRQNLLPPYSITPIKKESTSYALGTNSYKNSNYQPTTKQVSQKKSKQQNFREVLKRAQSNDACAQNELGLMYQYGSGVDQNYPKAVAWFEEAVKQGYVYAQYVRNKLGLMYQNGWGVDQDYQKAFAWYQEAADQGHAAAQHKLGRMYQNGLGVDQNYQKAVEYLQKAAAQGYVDKNQACDRLQGSGNRYKRKRE